MLNIYSSIIRFSITLLLYAGATNCFAYSSSPSSHTPKLDFFHVFSNNLPAELAQASKAEQFGVVLFFSTTHCPFCKRMKTTVFNQTSVQNYFKSKFRVFEIDIESPQHLINEQRQDVTRIDFAKSHRVRLTPTLVFLNQQGDVIYRHVGMIVDHQEFIWLGEYVVSGQTRKQNFAAFKMSKRRTQAP
ncbi:MAG: hypothetical protein A6F70_05105 [Cycloclasticus sp. symbiont of Bathymodiolus heckerae]|nr:MAG: hypothetical protein A6F70_05105 [Cycloclasticus sp. symbiont of Bathymodiolus heckerae]